jgi:iron complex transport system substrate-binding protein
MQKMQQYYNKLALFRCIRNCRQATTGIRPTCSAVNRRAAIPFKKVSVLKGCVRRTLGIERRNIERMANETHLTVMAPAERVVSLLPSATEIVAGLGCAGRLVGRSHECDYPASVESLPVCTRARVELGGSSAEIDASVRDAVKDAVSIYEVLEDQLQSLAPDVIVTQSQCEVCAVSFDEVKAAVASWSGCDPVLVSLESRTLAGVYKDITRVAEALGVSKAGHDLVTAMTGCTTAVADAAQGLDTSPAVACIEWTEPLMAAGNWIPEMVSLAGGKNIFGEAGEHAPGLAWEEFLDADPEVIILMPCGFDMKRAATEAGLLSSRPGWQDLAAVRAGRVYATDANAYFNRPGPRLADSLEIMAEILHPEVFQFGHENRGWQRVPEVAP